MGAAASFAPETAAMATLYAKDSKPQISGPLLVDAIAEESGCCLESYLKTSISSEG
jgi:hypothetical protein